MTDKRATTRKLPGFEIRFFPDKTTWDGKIAIEPTRYVEPDYINEHFLTATEARLLAQALIEAANAIEETDS